jgi:TRAP-type C4-dicarboxylate transport system permease small subunit
MQEKSSNRLLEKILAFMEACSIGTLCMLAVLILLQISLRNLFSIAFGWMDELARWFQVIFVYLMVPILYKKGQLLAVDSFVAVLPTQISKFIEIIDKILLLAFSVVFLISGHALMKTAGTVKTPALGLTNYVFFTPVFLGMGLLALTTLDSLLHWKRRESP